MAYTKTTWSTGDLITAAKLNNAETGIDTAQSTAETAQSDVDTHEALTNNPHSVTAVQAGGVGDGNGDGTDLYFAHVASDGTGLHLPAGWSSTRVSAGVYQVTHNFGSSDYVAFACNNSVATMVRAFQDLNVVHVLFADDTGTQVDDPFSLMVRRY